jgi:hypothetical protein
VIGDIGEMRYERQGAKIAKVGKREIQKEIVMPFDDEIRRMSNLI